MALVLVVVATGPLVQATVESPYVQEDILIASDGYEQHLRDARQGGYELGQGLAFENERAFLGAPYADDAQGDATGAVYVFAETETLGWSEVAKITPGSPTVGAEFGWSLAADGDRLVVGAPGDYVDGSFSGAVYVFERQAPGDWAKQTRLALDAATGDDVGWSVDVDGDTIIVGTHDRAWRGSVHVFEHDAENGWVMRTELDEHENVRKDFVGYSVALDEDRALVGAPGTAVQGTRAAGVTYVYERGAEGWTLQDRLAPTDPETGGLFGASLSLDGDAALVGEPRQPWGTDGSGLGHVFVADDGGGWSREAQLTADDAVEGERVGSSVALEGGLAVLGVGDPDTVVADVRLDETDGAAYVFAEDDAGWTEVSELRSADGAEEGWNVAVDGDRVLVGQPRDLSPNGFEAGSASIFTPVETLAGGPPFAG